MATSRDPFNARDTIDTPLGRRTIYRLDALGDLSAIPYSIKVLLESCLRTLDGHVVTAEDVQAIARYDAQNVGEVEIPFMPGKERP